MDWIRIESGAYWSVIVVSFLGVAIWETIRPRGDLSTPAARRWRNHSLILILSTVISAGLLRTSPMIIAASVAGGNLGLLNRPWLPSAARWILAFLLLDFVRYAIHRTFHAAPLLWRVHQVHHSDPDIDVSTALRFHPIEVILTHGAYLAMVAVLAPPIGAVLLSELVSIFQDFFVHANTSLPQRLQKWVTVVFFTPDTHRIHHSEDVWEQNRNFGQLFSWWDRLFHTYVPAPAAGHDAMIVGLRGYQNNNSLRLAFMLTQPFLPERRRGGSP